MENNLRVSDVEWYQTAGDQLFCEETPFVSPLFPLSLLSYFNYLLFLFRERNCGGDGHMFLYFPQQTVEPCVVYSWSVTVFVGDDRPLFSSTLDVCDMQFLATPEGLLFCWCCCVILLFCFLNKKKKTITKVVLVM